MIDAAVIGLGRWGKGIVESVQGKSRRLRIIRGVSKEPELVRDFAASKGFELSTDFEEAIADPRVRCVFLATPHSLHIRQIEAGAALGLDLDRKADIAVAHDDAGHHPEGNDVPALVGIAHGGERGEDLSLGNGHFMLSCDGGRSDRIWARLRHLTTPAPRALYRAYFRRRLCRSRMTRDNAVPAPPRKGSRR